MPTYLPPPRNWQDFEDLCCDLWRRLWSDPEAQKHGRSGQRQAGVDLVGRPKDGPEWVGVQCKHRGDRATLSPADIEREVELARTFKPPLGKLLIATTAPSDVAAQQVARDITERHREQGAFSVTVVSWDDILLHLAGYPDLVAKHYPDLAAAFQASLPAPTAADAHEVAVDPRQRTPHFQRQPELDFLQRVYVHAGGNPANLTNMLKVGAELGLSRSETKRVVQHLMAEGLIRHEVNRYRITLTAAGCRRVEARAQDGKLQPKKCDAKPK